MKKIVTLLFVLIACPLNAASYYLWPDNQPRPKVFIDCQKAKGSFSVIVTIGPYADKPLQVEC